MSEVTELLAAWRGGDETSVERLLPLVYDELRAIAERHMQRERGGHTLQPTALVHEAYLRLVDLELSPNDRAHLLAIASRAMRRVLIDHARGRLRQKRDGGVRVTMEPDQLAETPHEAALLDLDAALRELAEQDQRCAQALELKHFGGLTHPEIAKVLGVSLATTERDVRFARAWLAKRLRRERR